MKTGSFLSFCVLTTGKAVTGRSFLYMGKEGSWENLSCPMTGEAVAGGSVIYMGKSGRESGPDV